MNDKKNIIIGLGNPEPKYNNTRHNIGFFMVDRLASHYDFGWKELTKYESLIAKGEIEGSKYMFVKPLTYMNLSGRALQKILKNSNIPKDNLIIIYDDKDMDFGKIRFRQTGSSGGHNGIQSIIDTLGTKDFKRLKIGVKNELLQHMDTSDFVLANFTSDEKEKLNDIFNSLITDYISSLFL